MKQDLHREIISYITENQNKFYRLAFSYTKNREDALDAVQNAVCKALGHYKDLKNREAVKTWFYRILVNESLHLLRERNKLTLMGEDQAEEAYEENGFDCYDDLYEQIGRLDEDVQLIIKLRFFEEFSLKEIAEVMEMNLNTVKAKLYRGLKALKVSIQEVDV